MAHCEPSRSNAADAYVWKEETRVEGTQFELGERPFKRKSPTDWADIRDKALAGDLQSIFSQLTFSQSLDSRITGGSNVKIDFQLDQSYTAIAQFKMAVKTEPIVLINDSVQGN